MWLELVKRYKTPLVFCLDKSYPKGTMSELVDLLETIDIPVPDGTNCEDIVDIFIGKAKERGCQWVGRCFGTMNKPVIGTRHAWMFASLDQGIVDVEIQNKAINPPKYYAVAITY